MNTRYQQCEVVMSLGLPNKLCKLLQEMIDHGLCIVCWPGRARCVQTLDTKHVTLLGPCLIDPVADDDHEIVRC